MSTSYTYNSKQKLYGIKTYLQHRTKWILGQNTESDSIAKLFRTSGLHFTALLVERLVWQSAESQRSRGLSPRPISVIPHF